VTKQELIEKLGQQMALEYQFWGDIAAEDIVDLLDTIGLQVWTDEPLAKGAE
jgi:hypothetical protein